MLACPSCATACFFCCLIFCILALYASLVPCLIFSIGFVYFLLDFLLNYSLLHSFVVCRFLSVPLARFARLSVINVPCFGARQGNNIYDFVICFLFCAAVVYLLLVLLISCVCSFSLGGIGLYREKLLVYVFCALVTILLF